MNSSEPKSDCEKWSRYNQVSQRYLNLKEVQEKNEKKRKKELLSTDSSVVLDSVKTLKDQIEGEDQEANKIDNSIVDNIPAKFKDNAANLVRYLRQDGKV